MKCRSCTATLDHVVIDLGTAPPSNDYLTEDALRSPETWVPLRLYLCQACWLLQTEDFLASAEIFRSDYAYFSSTSTSWLKHASHFVDMAVRRFDLDARSLCVEVAANDGYLLRYLDAKGVPCVGIEPTASTAEAGRRLGLDMREFFLGEVSGRALASEVGGADLVIANNVLAHVPDLNDFIRGLATLLKPSGVLTVEFPRVTSLIDGAQFDTIYHEHYSYFSLTSVRTALEARGLVIFDVDEISTHGGSFRIYAQQHATGIHEISSRVTDQLAQEAAVGVSTLEYYGNLQGQANTIKNDLLRLLIDAATDGTRVAAYGAAAKGNTLINYAGIKRDLLPFVVDRSESKIGKYLPGSRIPIVHEGVLRDYKPDLIVILPWNIRGEVEYQLAYARAWGARFVTAVPSLDIY